MKDLTLPLKRQWFDLTKAKVKKEDYREVNEYWVRRLVGSELFSQDRDYISYFVENIHNKRWVDPAHVKNNIEFTMYKYDAYFRWFDHNIMTLVYPAKDDTTRRLKYKHEGIHIGYGNPEWGAVEGVLYFVIKHGEQVCQHPNQERIDYGTGICRDCKKMLLKSE